MDGDIDRLTAGICEHQIGDALGNPLDQIPALPGYQSAHPGGKRAIVDRGIETIGLAGFGEVDMHPEVDHEHLAGCLLMVEHPVPGEDP